MSNNTNTNEDQSNLDKLQSAARAFPAPAGSPAGFPFGVDASALLMNPAFAAVASLAAKQLQQQQQHHHHHHQQQQPLTAQQQQQPHQGTASPVPPSSASLQAAASSLLSGVTNATSAAQMTALLTSMTQMASQQQQPQPAAPRPTTPAVQQQQPNNAYAATTMARPNDPSPAANFTHHRHHPLAAAGHPAGAAISSALMPPNMQNWKLEQLEQHVKLLHQMNQPVPQSVALLLADARRKEEKKTAKRVANRKSACTSRARKKALVEEMTRTNARLRRQALILSLLPDLVIAISVTGEITFCSAQVERVLQHKIDNLIGANIKDILIPASRTALGKLINELVNNGKSSSAVAAVAGNPAAAADNDAQIGVGNGAENKPDENGNVSAENSSGPISSATSGAAAVVSDQSFPLSVVKVNSKQDPASDENDQSDESGCNGGGKDPITSSLTNTSSTPRSPSASLGNGSGSDDQAAATGVSKAAKDGTANANGKSSSDDSSSSASTETNNIREANENLERNVRWHNKKMSKSGKIKGHKDDVLGDSVTPNNALARLSSLQHYPEPGKSSKKRKVQYTSSGIERTSSEESLLACVEVKKKSANNNENASDDSGYRESNDSREETSSSASESSNSNGRNKPLAPTCNVCLIREDLTTLWCEVTSSIRTRHVDDASADEIMSSNESAKAAPNKESSNGSKGSKSSSLSSDEDKEKAEKPPKREAKERELLLCLRPIRDGEEKVDKVLRLIPVAERSTDQVSDESAGLAVALSTSAAADGKISALSPGADDAKVAAVSTGGSMKVKRPPKKRPLSQESSDTLTRSSTESGASSCAKRPRVEKEKKASSPTCDEEETEQSVVESLMLMNKSK